MKKLILVLMVLILIQQVKGDVIYVKIIDMVDGYENRAYIYQNDNMSIRYIKTENISETDEPFTLSTNHGYTINIEPKYHSILSNPTDEQFIWYWFDYIKYWVFGFGIIFIMVLIIWTLYKR